MQWTIWQEILAVFGALGLTATAVIWAAYYLFRWLGAKWIEGKFERQLEANRAEHSRELERLRHKINSVFDRTIRLHSKEFEVLPDLWAKLLKAHDTVGSCISPLQRSLDIHAFNDEQLSEVLETTSFMAFQKKTILDEPDPFERQKLFHRAKQLHRLDNARNHVRTFAIALKSDGIFVLPELRSDMDRMLQLTLDALQEHEMNAQYGTSHEEKYEHFETEAEGLLNKIESAVSDRLWDATKALV